MRLSVNIYCDESCHLPNDKESIMVLGAVYCPFEKKEEIFNRLFDFKKRHNLITDNKKKRYELKWNKISKSKIEYYKDVINYFFDNDYLRFRTIIVPDKSRIDYKKFNHTHDTFYYKMYFTMLKTILNPNMSHNVYIDIKDTKSKEKVHKLEQVLRNDKYDYNKQIIKKVQQVRSHEVEILQLTDLLIGAVGYINRGLSKSKTKEELVNLIKQRSKYSLTKTTLLKEQKFNIFVWQSQDSILDE